MFAAVRRKLAVAVRSMQSGGFPSHFVTVAPEMQNTVDIFAGEWASALPLEGVRSGTAPLFADPRLRKFLELEPVQGLNTLELGPLEGGHSFMLEQAGVGSVVAIEANARAYLKCLVVKEALELEKVRFLLGDVYSFLAKDPSEYDLVLAFGILYHLRDPQRLFEQLAPHVRLGGRLLLWTHYWTETIESECKTLRGHFTSRREALLPDGRMVVLRRHEYGSSIFKKGFFGGNAAYSEWMTRQGILDSASASGFQVEIDEDLDHHNGPSILAQFRKH